MSSIHSGGKKMLSLKQFILRAEAIHLYRNILRALQKLPDLEKAEIQNWARAEFEKNRHISDEYAIRGLLLNGKRQLRDLQKTINMAKS